MIDLVTGGAGFVGSHLVDALLANGRSVRVIDNFAKGRRSNLQQHAGDPRLEVIAADIADADAVMAACAGVERVYHLAGRAEIVPSIQDPRPYFETNVDGTFNVLQAARHHGVARLVYAASSSCYGIPSVYPTPEDASADPRYPYALTKYLGEQLVLHWAQVYGVPAISLRLFNIYGPRARTSGTYGAVFGVFLAQLLAEQPLTVVGDGEQTRDFTFVSDVVDAVIAAAVSNVSGRIFNVGSGRPASVNELIRYLGSPPTVNVPKRPGEPDCTWADITRIRSELGWSPKIGFAEGIGIIMQNLDYWRDAPVWTPASIRDATADWFKCLGPASSRVSSEAKGWVSGTNPID